MASQLLEHCRPMMGLFDLFHGSDAHQRNDLFDKVADTVVQMVVYHQKSTGDNQTFVALLQEALGFASGAHIRERIIKNIGIGDSNLKGQIVAPIFTSLKTIQESTDRPAAKLAAINRIIMPKLPEAASKLFDDADLRSNIFDSVALVLRGISVDANNLENDYTTALSAIQLALKLAKSADLQSRIQGDIQQLNANISVSKINTKPASSGCLVLFMIPSFVGMSLMYSLVKFFA